MPHCVRVRTRAQDRRDWMQEVGTWELALVLTGNNASSLLHTDRLTDPVTDPLENEVGDLQVILVLHDHVAVATRADFGGADHLRLAARRLEAADQCLTPLVPSLPRRERWNARRRVAMITEHDEDRHFASVPICSSE